ncbi:MAG: GYD domain-containing protein [Proteobacteria bacterium]|nr:GYD domain-containing protein [Pseudomonadota bacterium]
MGTYDIVIVSDFPSDEAAAAFALGAGSGGNVRSTTLKAFSESEYRKIIAALP